MYGDAVKADIQVDYVFSYEEALKKAKAEHKPIFFNCFSDWAVPCHAMNQQVFSNREFGEWLNTHFVNLWVEMTTEEGMALGERYGVGSMPYYLVLDENGEVVHRLASGTALPEFQRRVACALEEKTSYRGMNAVYAAGKHDKKFLRAYALVLRWAGEEEKYEEIAGEYFRMLKPAQWSKAENWQIFLDRMKQPDSLLVDYLFAHKADFVKENGAEVVNNAIVSLYYADAMAYAAGSKPYSRAAGLEVFTQLQKGNIPDTNDVYKFLEIASLRHAKKYAEMLDYLSAHIGRMDSRVAELLDMSLGNLPEITPEGRKQVAAYLQKRMEGGDDYTVKHYSRLIDNILNFKGMVFEELSLQEALDKAGREGKRVFMDCYTTWCGPCRMMAAQVFTQQKVGDYFNEHFVSLKMDMEKGEGITLGKKYGVTAYPTMLILDTQGNVMHTMVGSRSAEELIKEAREHSDPAKGYAVSKAAYEAGERTPDAIANYITALVSAKELTALQGDSLATTYLDGWDDAKFCDASSWPLLEAAVVNPQGKAFSRLLKLHDGLTKAVPAEKVNKKIERVCFPVVLDYLQHKTEKDAVLRLLEPLKQGTYPAEYTLVLIEDLLRQENVDDVLAFYRQRVQGMQNPQDQLNMDSLLPYFLEKATESQKAKFVEYMTDRAKNCDKRAARKYAVLLEVIKQGGYKG